MRRAARRHGLDATIVVPHGNSVEKNAAMRALGVTLVEHGLTRTIRDSEIHASGKTGTSDWTYDVQFVGFTSRHIAMVWMGDDKRVRTLGRDDAAYTSIVPLWPRFMWMAAKNFPNVDVPWEVPPGVDPDDRGDHTKGHRIGKMSLTRHYAKDQMERDGLVPPPGAETGGGE